MISLFTICLLILVHWFADFVMQSDEMAINKSKSNKWLLKHVVLYSLFFVPFGFWFAFVNLCCHFVTDWTTSRITSHLWKKGARHNFFVVVGIDQAIHLITLILTYSWMH